MVALVVASVAWVAHFTTSSYFFFDDYIYLRDAQRSGLSAPYLFRQLNVHVAPGYRAVDWAVQTLFPLDFGVAQTLLLLGFAASVILVHRLLVELFGPGRGPLVLAAIYATSLVQVGVIQWWSSGLQIVPSVLFSLLSMLAYLRFHQRGSRRALTWSVATFVLGSLFYIKAVLVPLYLVTMRLFVLDPEVGFRDKLRSLRSEGRVWAAYVVPIALYLLLYLTVYWAPSKAASWSLVVQYLHISWVRTFVPSVAGIYAPATEAVTGVPAGGSATAVQAGIVLAQVLFLSAVAWSVYRRHAAWKAWAFLGVGFLLNALLVGLPRLRQWGVGTGYLLRYYPEATYLLPIALGAAFLAHPRPGPAERGSIAVPRPVVAALGVGLALHLAVASAGAAALARQSPGRLAGPYMRAVASGIHRVERSGMRPTIIDGTVPDYVVASWSVYGPPYSNRYSEVFPLLDDRLTFDRLDSPVFTVADDGKLQPVTFQPDAGGSAPEEVQKGSVVVSGGQVESRGDRLCVRAPTLASSRIEFTPTTPMTDREWFLALRYSSGAREALALSVDHGSGYAFPYDRSLDAEGGPSGSLLTRLGPGTVTRLRLDLPPRSQTCLERLEIGHVLAQGASSSPEAPLAVGGGLDSFSRFDSPTSLGTMPGGPSWRSAAGVWAVGYGQAYPARPIAERNLAVVPLGHGDGAVQVRLAHVVQGAGVVFRYRDPANYWYVAATPTYASWAVVKVVAGHEESVANTGFSPVGDGTTVAVRFEGATIKVALDGTVKAKVTDAALADAGGVGLAVRGPDAVKVRFDDFRAAVPGDGAPSPG